MRSLVNRSNKLPPQRLVPHATCRGFESDVGKSGDEVKASNSITGQDDKQTLKIPNQFPTFS